MKILKIDRDVFELGFEFDWDKLMEYYNNKGFDAMEFCGLLNLYDSNITSMPNNLTVSDELNLYNAKITSLPDNLSVGRNLDLRYSRVLTKSLSNNLSVGGNLKTQFSDIVFLSDNLTVGGDFYYGRKIISLPDNLIVNGRIIKH